MSLLSNEIESNEIESNEIESNEIDYTYHIYKRALAPDNHNIMVTFKQNDLYTILNMKDYTSYSLPTNKHKLEPDGSIFVCDSIDTTQTNYFNFNFRQGMKNEEKRCVLHNKPEGYKYNLGPNHKDFLNRSLKELNHCRCYCKPVNQYEYDKWCYDECMKHDSPLCDNSKIYILLTQN